MAKFDLKQYARKGAAARVAELQGELASIFRAFPDLRAGRPGRRATAVVSPQAVAAPSRRRRSKMTAAQRKAVSARMKKYWAERRGKSAK